MRQKWESRRWISNLSLYPPNLLLGCGRAKKRRWQRTNPSSGNETIYCVMSFGEKSNQNNGAEPLTRHEILRAFKKLSNKDIKTVFAIKKYMILMALFAFGLFKCIILKWNSRAEEEKKKKSLPNGSGLLPAFQECCPCHSSNKRNCIKHHLQRASKDLAQYTAPPCLMHSTIDGIQSYMHFDKHNEMEFITLYANWWSLGNCIL